MRPTVGDILIRMKWLLLERGIAATGSTFQDKKYRAGTREEYALALVNAMLELGVPEEFLDSTGGGEPLSQEEREGRIRDFAFIFCGVECG